MQLPFLSFSGGCDSIVTLLPSAREYYDRLLDAFAEAGGTAALTGSGMQREPEFFLDLGGLVGRLRCTSDALHDPEHDDLR